MTTIGSQFDQLAALIIGKNKIEVEWSFFAQLQQSRGGLPQAVNQALDGVNSVNSGSAQWWSGTSHDAASDMLTSVVSGDDTSLSKFSDQLAQQNAQNQHLGELVGQAKDDMHRIVLSAYDQIGQLGASGASGTGGYGPQAMSVIDNAKKAVDDVVLVLLGQIRGARDSAQETANRFTSGKTGGKEAEGHEQAHDDLLAQGNQLKIAAPEAGHNKDGSAAADTKDNDGRAVAATAHANGKTATAVEGKDKDRDLVAGAKHDNGAQAPNASVSKDKKDANTEPDSSKTTSTTKPDGTPQTNDEALAAARGSDEPDKAGGEPRADTGGSRSDGPSYFGGGNGGAGLPGGPGGGGPGGGGGFGGDHGGFGGGPGNGPGGFGGDHGQGNQGSQVQTPADNRGQNTLFHTTPSAWDHTANPTGAIGETHANPTSGPLTAPQSSTSLSTNPQSGATNSSNTPNSGNPAQPNSAEARQSPHAPQGGSPLAGTPAGAQGPLGQLANAATQAAGPIGNIAGTAASIGGNIAGAATSLGQTAAPPVSSAPGTGGPGFPGSEFKPAPGNVTSTNFAGSSGVGAPTPPRRRSTRLLRHRCPRLLRRTRPCRRTRPRPLRPRRCRTRAARRQAR